MKLIIAGSRTRYPSIQTINDATADYELFPSEIVSGGARGADMAGEVYAKHYNFPIKRFDADWSTGKGAGFARNSQMADYADVALVFWDGVSKGSLHMVDEMRRRGKPVHLIPMAKAFTVS